MAACGPGAHPPPNAKCLSPHDKPNEPSPILDKLPPRPSGPHPALNEICLSRQENPDEPSPVLEKLPPRLAADGAGRFVSRLGRRTRTECRGEVFHPGRYRPGRGRGRMSV